jgi:hypothetical protein
MTATRLRFKALDIVIFLFALLLIGLISLQTYVRGGGTPEITIEAAGVPAAGVPAAGDPAAASGEQQWIFPLDAQTTLRVPGPLGETVVVIEDGTVRVVSSPCPEKICIKTGRISKPGQWIACLPNRVFISIRGKRSEQPDAISQ